MTAAGASEKDDVLVPGGGFAGLIAARDLCAQGFRVTLLEARDRLGGRTWTTTMPGIEQDDVLIELGGTWLTVEGHPALASEVTRYDIALSQSPVIERIILINGTTRTVPTGTAAEVFGDLFSPVSGAIMRDAEILRASLAHDGTVPAEFDAPASEWIQSLQAPQATEAFLLGWTAGAGGGNPDELSAMVMLAEFAEAGEAIDDLFSALDMTFTDGTRSLVDAIAAEVTGVIETRAIVRSVIQDEEGVTVGLEDGRMLRARAAVIALPLNCWPDIDFSPPLHETKRSASAQGHPGRSTKVVTAMKGFTASTVGLGWDHAIQGALGMQDLNEGSIVACFDGLGLLRDATDPNEVEAAVRAFEPDASLIASTTHDWINDPYSRGTWMAWPPGWANGVLDDLARPEGRLIFAGSDVASEGSGYIEGAVVSGREAAELVTLQLRHSGSHGSA